MSKSKIIITIFVIIAITGSIVGGLLLQRRSITLRAVSTPFQLLSEDTVIREIEDEATLQLHDGQYCALAIDDEFSDEKECFTVYKSDETIDIDFDYSEQKLDSILEGEWASIRSSINSKYASIISSYTICEGNLINKGAWYTGIIQDKVFALSEPSNYYRIILEKQGDEWIVKNIPSVVVSYSDGEENQIPANVVKVANNVEGCDLETAPAELLPENSTTKPLDYVLI